MSSPLYDVGNVVYLRESAAIGFLEAVTVNSVHRYGTKWVYTISSGIQNNGISMYGDRTSRVNTSILFFDEDEFVSKCDALVLAEANALARYNSIRTQREELCPDE